MTPARTRLRLLQREPDFGQLDATGERSSSATTSPSLTWVPSGTIDWILTPFQTSACCMFCGPVMFTNLGARSSPLVVTTMRKSPRLTVVSRRARPACRRAGNTRPRGSD
jgi:hypothetical protein